MREAITCWAPECIAQMIPKPNGRAPKYCSARCRTRAFRRNDGKAPDHPYPPLAPGAVQPPRPPAPRVADKARPDAVPDPRRTPTVPGLFSDAPKSPDRKPYGFSATPPTARKRTTRGTKTPPTIVPDVPDNVVQLPPPAAVPPAEPPPESEIVTSVRAALESAGKTGWQADQALTVAMRMSSESTSPASVSQLSRELTALMTELTKGDPSAAGANPADVIRARTLRKLAAVGAL